MKSKSDAIVVVPTPFNSIKAFIIFQNYWIIADIKYLYKMSKNAQKLINQLEVEETQYLYKNSDKIIVQTKEGWIHIVKEDFSKENSFHLNIFSFCRLSLHEDFLYFINSNQLEARNLTNLQTEYYDYQTEIFCTSIKVIGQEFNQFIIIVLDNGIIDVLKNKILLNRYQLNQTKTNNIFIYDCYPMIYGKDLIIAASTNQQSILILKDQDIQQIINISFSATTIFTYSKTELSPLIAFNKDRFSLITSKEICKYDFTNISNYYFEKYCFLSTNEQIIIVDFNYLKK